ncbi:MAG: CCA tRNA nucleotidyltransferase [Planctomycetaceae bacterium]
MTGDNLPQTTDSQDPQCRFAEEVVRKLVDAGYTALWAGGCVRDLLMGRAPDDYDVATTAHPDEVRNLFGRRKTLAVGESFGVIIVLGPREAGQVEVATFRTEGSYGDGRRPDRVAYATPEEDAQRRDFTINGMFYNPLTKQVLDYVQGEHDLHIGIVRAIGDPQARMSEDKLRMLRAVRFAATLDFELDPATAAAVQAMSTQLSVVSWERIAAELQKMLRHRHRRRAVRLLQQLDLLSQVVPEFTAMLADEHDPEWTLTLNILDRLETARFETAAAAWMRTVPVEVRSRNETPESGTVEAICRRLKLSNQQRDDIVWLVKNRHALAGADQFSPARLKRLVNHSLIGELLTLAQATALAEHRRDVGADFVADYLRNTPREEIDPPALISGQDLLALGLQAGPEFRDWLEAVRDLQLNGEIRSRDEAIEVVQRLSKSGSTG